MYLPPNIETLSSFKFGTFSLSIQSITIYDQNQADLLYCAIFKGFRHNPTFSIRQKIYYNIMTTLWHFYLYLTDLQQVTILIMNKNNQQLKYRCSVPIQTISSSIVLNEDYVEGQVLKVKEYQCSIINEIAKVGSLKVSMRTSFYRHMHLRISHLVNFKSMLVIEGISRIGEEIEVPRIPPTKSFVQNSHISNLPLQQFKQELQNQPKLINESDEQNLNDEIDRMIAQMHQKPYDSSRYQSIQQNQIQQNMQVKVTNLALNKPLIKVGAQNMMANKIPSLPPLHRTYSTSIITEDRVKTNSAEKIQLIQKAQPKSWNSLGPFDLKLQIHQLLIVGGFQEQDYELSMCVDGHEDLIIIGQEEGDAVIYNHTKIFHDSNIQTLLFRVGKLEGTFSMQRLHSLPNKKGYFMVALLHSSKPDIKCPLQSLKKVQSPTHLTLRISLQVEQKDQILQVYLSIDDILTDCTSIRYKLPYTKDIIEFTQSHHFNVFPHSRTHQIIILEFWNNQKLRGVSEINLKAMQSTNMHAINASLQPIYLHEGVKQISSFADPQKVIGSYILVLCFGTVKQIQKMLKGKPQKKVQKVEVRLDEKLKVFVKEKKNNVSTECQVNIEDEKTSLNLRECFQTKMQSPHFKQRQLNNSTFSEMNNNYSSKDQNSLTRNGKKSYIQGNKEDLLQQNHCLIQIQQGQFFTKQVQSELKTKNEFNQSPNSLKSLTQGLSDYINKNLWQLTDPTLLQQLKSFLKPHILYNFVTSQILASGLKHIGISRTKTIHIIDEILNPSNQMVNLNVFYDYIVSLQINQSIKPNLIPNSLFTYFSLSVVVSQHQTLDQKTQFEEMKKTMMKFGYKLTMHEYNSIHQHLNKLHNLNCLSEYMQNIRSKKEKDILNQQFQKNDEDQIVKVLYGQQEVDQDFQKAYKQRAVSQKYENIKQRQQATGVSVDGKLTRRKVEQKLKLIVTGLQKCQQSAQCLLDNSMDNSYLNIVIGYPIEQKLELKNDCAVDINCKDQVMEGQIRLCKEGNVMAMAAFAITMGIKSVYALKANQQFCGLISLFLTNQLSED